MQSVFPTTQSSKTKLRRPTLGVAACIGMVLSLVSSVGASHAELDSVPEPEPEVAVQTEAVPHVSAARAALMAPPEGLHGEDNHLHLHDEQHEHGHELDESEYVLVAELETTPDAPFSLIGLTWERSDVDEFVHVDVRTRRDGAWTDWEHLHTEDIAGEGGLAGTEPMWVGPSDAAAVRVFTPNGATLDDLSLTMIDPDALDTDSQIDLDGVVAPMSIDPPSGMPSRPNFIMRSTWRPTASQPSCNPVEPGYFRAVTVHHTAGANNYTQAEAIGYVRGIHTFHVRSRGWCDIGYNALIDRFGRVYEGRRGGLLNMPRGAHAGDWDVNSNAWGVSIMGNFSNTAPSQAARNTLVQVTAWKFAIHGVNPIGQVRIGNKTVHRIHGHRDVYATACPGQHLYSFVTGGMRTQVNNLIPGNPDNWDWPRFPDVPFGHQFAEEIKWITDVGVATGYSNGAFRPKSSIERQAVVAFLFRYASLNDSSVRNYQPPAQSPFDDVSPGDQFYRQIAWAHEMGITTGFADGTFRPQASIHRNAVAAFMYQFTIWLGDDAPVSDPRDFVPPSSSPFSDLHPEDRFYREITWLRSTRLTTGFADGTYRPYTSIQRQAVAAFLYRYDGL